jgi:mono/diheme cytochrome c family protein
MVTTRTTLVVNGCLAIGLFLVSGAATLGAQRQSQSPRILTDMLAGRDSFELYCSSCHGKQGRGDGPVATVLNVKPADLSRLAQRNGGTFPVERVLETITFGARPVPAHGTSEMPIWGELFGALESKVRARERIANIVTYVQALQVPPTDLEQSGVQLFKTYCASCHGPAGHGDGPVAAQLRTPPPDLTRYTARNGGVFPSERLRQIIDGTGVGAHGGRDMPVWGDAFRTGPGGLTPDAVAQRIDAIVWYLQTIQGRAGE